MYILVYYNEWSCDCMIVKYYFINHKSDAVSNIKTL